jgi:DNA (cytosine-5)-methyltransferase 1
MVKHGCETCQKTFAQKDHLEMHKNRKRLCKKETTIEPLVEQNVQEVLSKTNMIAVKIESTPTVTIQSSNMDYTTKTREELIAVCKEKSIKGYSGKKKEEIVQMLTQSIMPDLTDKTKQNFIVYGDSKIRIASLFAGCGGLDYGFHNNTRYTSVFVNDFDADACNTYEKNFKIKPTCGDIKQIKTIPDCDMIIGGFPCQGFSMANPYRDEKDKRNELYLEILRLLKLKQPKYFLLENVKGLLNMGGYETTEDKKNQTGKVMKVILKDLEECGYNVKFKLFDIKEYNVPQKRQRVIIIGVRSDIDFTPNWPEPSNTILTLKDAIGDLPIEYKTDIQHIGTKHKCAVTGYLGNRELKWDEPSPTITGRGGGSGGPVIHNHPSLKRRLTVRECARIQTFPDSFEFIGSISSMYKQLGNAVPCKFAEFLSIIFEKAP